MLVQWLVKFKNITVSKFSLYFHSILAQQTTAAEMKFLSSKQTFDPYHKWVTTYNNFLFVCEYILPSQLQFS